MSAAFEGPLAAPLEEFATLMRSTGGLHVSLLATLRRFDKFVARSFPQTTTVSKEILLAWFASFDHLRPDRATAPPRFTSASSCGVQTRERQRTRMSHG